MNQGCIMKDKFKEGNEHVEKPIQHVSAKHTGNHEKEPNLISTSNDGLIIAKGFKLAIVDGNNKVVISDKAVQNVVFKALASQVIQSFCNRFKSFTEDDFKQPR